MSKVMNLVNELQAKFPTIDQTSVELAVSYLKYYGHLNGHVDEESFYTATKQFQEFFGLEQDGLLGPKTFRAMQGARCGVRDILRINAEEAKWRKRDLKVLIEDYDKDLDFETFKAIVSQSWKQWEAVCGIHVEVVTSGRGDIILGVGRGRTSDFDGPSGVLAWAELPNGSDGPLTMKIDLDETWIVDPNRRGILLLNVLCHENGHSLGLEHSRVQTALMAPYYAVGVAKPQQNDDVTRIQSLYGPPVNVSPTDPEPTPTDSTTIVLSGKIDKINIPGWRVTRL